MPIFTNQKAEPEALQENIIVVFPVPAVSHYSTLDLHSKPMGPKLDHR
jgi:hypothetical protein